MCLSHAGYNICRNQKLNSQAKILLFKEKKTIKESKAIPQELCSPRATKARAPSCSLHLRNIIMYLSHRLFWTVFQLKNHLPIPIMQQQHQHKECQKINKPRNVMKIYPELITLPTTQAPNRCFLLHYSWGRKSSVDVILVLCFLLSSDELKWQPVPQEEGGTTAPSALNPCCGNCWPWCAIQWPKQVSTCSQ